MEFFQDMQNVYRKWEEKAQPKMPTNNNIHSGDTLAVAQNTKGTTIIQSAEETVATSDYNKHLVPRQWTGPAGQGNISTTFTQKPVRNRFRLPALKLPQWDRLSQFKTTPIVTSDLGPLRSNMGHCCARCVPTSRLAFLDDPSSTLGITNILCVPTQNRENGIIVRAFHHVAFLLKKNIGYLYPDVSAKVLRCDRVVQAVELAIEQEIFDSDIDRDELEPLHLDMLKQKHSKRAIEALTRMRSCISSVLLRLAGWVLYKLLGRMLSGINVQKGNLENLRKVSKRNLPIVYLPLHRSHLDYILVTFILYISDLKAPVIAAGDNLLIPFFGALMRGLGAFFIKRKLDTQEGRKDHVYRAILHSYMSECLKANHSLEFFIEGGRSRTGKACMPKSGLLSVVVDSVLEGTVEDAFIVPVGISYEKILDGNFVPEQLGKPKSMESFKSAITAIWSTLHSDFGTVRVDFCQPFSIKEFLQAAKRRYSVVVPVIKPMQNSQPVHRKSSTSSLYGLDIVTEDNREVIRDLAKHIIYDASNSTAAMSTNMLSFLLLTKYRKGATLQQLMQSMNWLKDELSSRQRDIGFSGETADVIKHAWTLLGKDLVTTETIQMEWSSLETEASNVKITFYKPVIILPFVLELQYYANSLVSAFLMESIVVNALFAELDEVLEPWRGCKSQVSVSCNGVVQKCLDLCDILQYEFIFTPPCSELSSVIFDTIDRLVTGELLSPLNVTPSNSDKRAWANRMESNIDWDSSDEEDGLHHSRDQRFKVSLSEESLNKLQFLRCILSPVIESYWVSACSLVKLVHTQKEESLFFREIQKTAEERLHKGLLTYEESFAAEPLRNSLKLFQQWNVLESHVQDSVRLLYLQTKYDSEDRLQEIVSRIEDFRK